MPRAAASVAPTSSQLTSNATTEGADGVPQSQVSCITVSKAEGCTNSRPSSPLSSPQCPSVRVVASLDVASQAWPFDPETTGHGARAVAAAATKTAGEDLSAISNRSGALLQQTRFANGSCEPQARVDLEFDPRLGHSL